MMSLEDLICSGYTYLEFNCDFDKYHNACTDSSYEDNKKGWEEVKASYRELNQDLSDHTITAMFNFIMDYR